MKEEEKDENVEELGIQKVSIIVGGNTGSGKSTIAQLISDALEKSGFHVSLKDDEDQVSEKVNTSRKIALLKKGCPIQINTLRLGQAGVNALERMQPKKQAPRIISGPASKGKIIV